MTITVSFIILITAFLIFSKFQSLNETLFILYGKTNSTSSSPLGVSHGRKKSEKAVHKQREGSCRLTTTSTLQPPSSPSTVCPW